MSGKVASFDQLLAERAVIICCGSGGVGKTTTSASIALAAAMRGKRAVVCTIDPARRLANSLGLQELGNEVIEVALVNHLKSHAPVHEELDARLMAFAQQHESRGRR